MPIGTSSDLMLGETVFAIGNAFGYENTITLGIVSSPCTAMWKSTIPSRTRT